MPAAAVDSLRKLDPDSRFKASYIGKREAGQYERALKVRHGALLILHLSLPLLHSCHHSCSLIFSTLFSTPLLSSPLPSPIYDNN
jgi:hypothetical protein